MHIRCGNRHDICFTQPFSKKRCKHKRSLCCTALETALAHRGLRLGARRYKEDIIMHAQVDDVFHPQKRAEKFSSIAKYAFHSAFGISDVQVMVAGGMLMYHLFDRSMTAPARFYLEMAVLSTQQTPDDVKPVIDRVIAANEVEAHTLRILYTARQGGIERQVPVFACEVNRENEANVWRELSAKAADPLPEGCYRRVLQCCARYDHQIIQISPFARDIVGILDYEMLHEQHGA